MRLDGILEPRHTPLNLNRRRTGGSILCPSLPTVHSSRTSQLVPRCTCTGLAKIDLFQYYPSLERVYRSTAWARMMTLHLRFVVITADYYLTLLYHVVDIILSLCLDVFSALVRLVSVPTLGQSRRGSVRRSYSMFPCLWGHNSVVK